MMISAHAELARYFFWTPTDCEVQAISRNAGSRPECLPSGGDTATENRKPGPVSAGPQLHARNRVN